MKLRKEELKNWTRGDSFWHDEVVNLHLHHPTKESAWDLLNGQLRGPTCHAGHCHDLTAAIAVEDLPEQSLSLADLGFWHLVRLCAFSAGGRHRQRFFVSRYKTGTALSTRGGHRIELAGVLPQQVGQVIDQGSVWGRGARGGG